MKRLSILFLLFVILFVSCSKHSSAVVENEITVYCYDSFLGSWGAGEKITKGFTEKTGVKVNLVGCGGAAELYSRVLFEGSSCEADVVLGLSESINVDKNLFSRYQEYDYGIFAFILNTDEDIEVPRSLQDLKDAQYKDKLILVDPRTSAVGLGLLKWTVLALGEEEAFSWWECMKDIALTIAASWSAGYGIFTQGEAPLVISYTTSPVYHLLYENNGSYVALPFSDGHIKTSEYAGVLAKSEKQEQANAFMDYLMNEGQVELAVANTMFPSNPETVLPQAFDELIDVDLIEDDRSFESDSLILDRWTQRVCR